MYRPWFGSTSSCGATSDACTDRGLGRRVVAVQTVDLLSVLEVPEHVQRQTERIGEPLTTARTAPTP